MATGLKPSPRYPRVGSEWNILSVDILGAAMWVACGQLEETEISLCICEDSIRPVSS